jgi:hypothetical protein
MSVFGSKKSLKIPKAGADPGIQVRGFVDLRILITPLVFPTILAVINNIGILLNERFVKL